MTAIEGFAEFAYELRLSQLPASTVCAASRVFSDFIGNCVGGAAAAEVSAIREVVVQRGGRPEATILCTGERVPAVDAAYVNGAAADAFEYQDGYRFGGYHPSHSLPAILAMAEVLGSSRDELLEAVIVAYEVANRVARSLHPDATLRGWFPLAAGYGAAAGASRLRGSGVDELREALGAVPFFTPAILIDGIFAGPSIKPAFAGQFARAGMEAVEHAAAGLTGWSGALDAERGLIALLTGGPVGAVLTGLGEEWTVEDVHQKGFASCRHTHGAVEAALKIHAEGLDAGEVKRIDVYAYTVAKQLVDRQTDAASPTSQCVLSLPYATAAALLDGDVGPAQYLPDRVADPTLQDLASRVLLHVDPAIEARYPDETPSRVSILLRDGTTREAEVAQPQGDPRNPLSQDQLDAKLRANLALNLDDDAQQLVLRQLHALRQGGEFDVRRLVTACVGAAHHATTASQEGPQ